MSEEAKRRALGLLAAQHLARESLADYGRLLVRGYQEPRHVRALCEHLEALRRREIQKLAVCLPPRHSKSLHTARLYPAWHLGHHPEDQVIIASYGAELAVGHSRSARALLADPRSPFDVNVSTESSAADRWHTTAGGMVRAAGVLGALTGHGADVLIVDDPVKDREAADSEAVREATARWWAEVALTRLMPGGRILLCGTRWHPDDLLGRVLDGPGGNEWTTLVLPALAEDSDPLGRAEGEALWPEWFPLEHLEALRVEIGPRAWEALFQQSPTPQSGNLFHRDWFAGRYSCLPEDGLRVVTACDASFGKTNGDFSALVTIAADNTNYYVIDAVRGRWTFNELLAQIRGIADDFQPQQIVIEDAAAGQSAIQALRRESNLPITPVKAQGSKVARAEAVSGLLEAGRVLLPGSSPRWVGELVEEAVAFPAGKHDDYVDAMVYALRHLRERSGGGGGAEVLYYEHGRLVSSGDAEFGSPSDEMSALAVYKRIGHRDPLAGGVDEFEDDEDD